MYYCGSNDVNAGVDADTIAGNFAEFSRRVTAALPESHLVYVSINRSAGGGWGRGCRHSRSAAVFSFEL